MAKGYDEREGLTTEDLGLSLDDLRGEPLELLVREGARLLLSIALEEEITEFLGRRRYERIAGRGYRNGHRERQVTCSAGELSIPVPRVADAPDTFRSSLLGAWQRRSRLVEEVLPLLYIEGLSTRDFRRALAPLWGKSGPIQVQHLPGQPGSQGSFPGLASAGAIWGGDSLSLLGWFLSWGKAG